MAGDGLAEVRDATEADLPRLVEMGRKFHEASPWASVSTFDEEAFRHSLVWLMDAPNGVLLVSEQGMVGGFIFPLFFATGRRVAQELFWFSEDGEGRALLSEFERVSKAKGACAMVMGALETLRPDAVARALRGIGYRPTERLYMKEL